MLETRDHNAYTILLPERVLWICCVNINNTFFSVPPAPLVPTDWPPSCDAPSKACFRVRILAAADSSESSGCWLQSAVCLASYDVDDPTLNWRSAPFRVCVTLIVWFLVGVGGAFFLRTRLCHGGTGTAPSSRFFRTGSSSLSTAETDGVVAAAGDFGATVGFWRGGPGRSVGVPGCTVHAGLCAVIGGRLFPGLMPEAGGFAFTAGFLATTGCGFAAGEGRSLGERTPFDDICWRSPSCAMTLFIAVSAPPVAMPHAVGAHRKSAFSYSRTRCENTVEQSALAKS